ncbi:ROK family protein [Asticcacaulis sp.]|uniref:ROK family protein n=1 Tax=Asticcacaulis sp. TaxID=1872648 RepID=UPI00260E2CED|nr:ROK family protein [Asticcacaulis sp.]
MPYFAALEVGGTKVNVAVGSGPDDLQTLRIPTRAPQETWPEVLRVLDTLSQGRAFDAIGIASFGPIDVNPQSSTYGRFRKTPKPGWSGFDLLSPLTEAYPEVPVGLDTDVNGAALGEKRWGGAKDLDTFVYVTVGTGLGVGLVVADQPVHGLLHPEAGHIRVRRHPDDTYAGHCPFHGDCCEGLSCGPAIEARTEQKAETLPPDHPVWGMVGDYLGQLFCNLALITSAQRILVGGGVGLNEPVLRASRQTCHRLLNGYLEALDSADSMDRYIQAAHLGDRAGMLGAIELARRALC